MTSLAHVEEFTNSIMSELRFLEQPGYYAENEGFSDMYRRAKFASGRFKDIYEQVSHMKEVAELSVEKGEYNKKEIAKALEFHKKHEKIRTRLQKVVETLEQRSFQEREKEKEVILMNAKKKSEKVLKLRAQQELDYKRIKEMKRRRRVAKRALEKETERLYEEEKIRLGQVLKTGSPQEIEKASFDINFTPSTNVFNRQSLRKFSESHSISTLYQHMLKNNTLSQCVKATEIFLTLLLQIVDKPDNKKIRVLRASNARFQESVVRVCGSLACLLKIGFMDVVCEQSALMRSGSSAAAGGVGNKKELWYVMKVPSPIDDSYGWSSWMEDMQQNIVFFKKMLGELKKKKKI